MPAERRRQSTPRRPVGRLGSGRIRVDRRCPGPRRGNPCEPPQHENGRRTVKLMIRLTIWGLAVYGGTKLWEQCRDVAMARKDELADAAHEWKDTVSATTQRAAREVSETTERA